MITGTIRDAALSPLARATLTLASPSLPGGAQTTLTSSRGAYRFPELPSGVYELTAEFDGLQTVKRTNLRVPVGTTLTVDITLRATRTSGVPDAVTESSAGPIVDVTTAASMTTLSREELENLPVAGLTFVQLVPGITRTSNFGNANGAIQFVADGSPLTLWGSAQAVTTPLNVYWMEEAQVVGLGATAEHGEFSGAMAKVVFRSGSNRFSGFFEHRTTRPGWVSDNTGGLVETLRQQFRPQEILSRWNSAAQVGGPILRDRVFFFAGFEHARNKVFQAGTIGNVPLDSRRTMAVSKLNWMASRNVTVEGYVVPNQMRTQGSLGRNQLPEAAVNQSVREPSWSGRVAWTVNSRTMVEFQNGGVDLRGSSVTGHRRAGPPPHRDRVTGILSGNAANFSDRSGYRSVTSGSLTRFTEGSAGRSHELKVGFELERAKSREVSGVPGGRSFIDAGGAPEQVLLWDGDRSEATGTRATLYVQDEWALTNRLSIHPGMRLGVNRGAVPDKGTVFKTNPVSPRIGLAWDVADDHKTVVRGAYSRIHEGLYPVVYSFLNTVGLTTRITARVLGPDTFQELTRVTPAGRVAVNESLTHSFVDEYLVSLERELFPDSSLKVQYVRRHFTDIWAMIDTGSRYEPVQRQDPGPDGRLGTSDDGSFLTVFNLLNPGESFQVLTNPEDAYRRYDALQVIGQKRYSDDWQLLAAYTWSKTRGTVNNVPGNVIASGQDTGAPQGSFPPGVFFNPNRRIGADGPTGYDFRHQASVQGVYQIPIWGGVNVSPAYRYLSGGAWGRFAMITGLQQGNQGVRIEPSGTRRTNASSQVDLRVEKTFRLGSSGRTAGIYADVFNVTNEGIAFVQVEASGATFGQPQQWAAPRTLQVAARIKF